MGKPSFECLRISILVVVPLLGYRITVGPPAEVVKQAAESLFERAAHGEPVPAKIPFTAPGPAVPRLIKTEITANRQLAYRGGELFEYDVRLTYLNRIQQMEPATVTVRFEWRGRNWEPSFPPCHPGRLILRHRDRHALEADTDSGG